jgi:hypothetical protein
MTVSECVELVAKSLAFSAFTTMALVAFAIALS